MIVDPSTTTLMSKDTITYDEQGQPMQAPPSYDAAVGSASNSGPYVPESAAKATDVKVPPPSDPYSAGSAPPPQTAQMPSTVVYNYVNPATGERVVSLLPPDHPQMVCLQQGGHVARSKFGLLGILAAVFWFPLGVGLCLLDRKVYCERCGVIIDEGMC
ncbi:hypothetical protein PYCCODRAFT_1474224 [Trametes coccinea BRFM310]|uniref:Uncharacterized protein n=1 Tax=Trametes coccinea (strain BRFM310) TaxID=1353009 RepID=A0A1Y2J070_TRAC3|nr:hypothetical protein PYCCODRAFT_1474224 [Trametes coccinea BRFM310]